MKTTLILAAVATLAAAQSTVTCSSGCPKTSSVNDIVTRSPVPSVSCTAAPLTIVSAGAAAATGSAMKSGNGTAAATGSGSSGSGSSGSGSGSGSSGSGSGSGSASGSGSKPTYTPIAANGAGKLGGGIAGVAVAVGAVLLL